jgi:hypothetical protein
MPLSDPNQHLLILNQYTYSYTYSANLYFLEVASSTCNFEYQLLAVGRCTFNRNLAAGKQPSHPKKRYVPSIIKISIPDHMFGRGIESQGWLCDHVQVSQGSNYYVPAKVALADIYMKHQHDKARFSKCYMDIVQLFPNSKVRRS